jgi:hypothetical protein
MNPFARRSSAPSLCRRRSPGGAPAHVVSKVVNQVAGVGRPRSVEHEAVGDGHCGLGHGLFAGHRLGGLGPLLFARPGG